LAQDLPAGSPFLVAARDFEHYSRHLPLTLY
jgi:hypothetical protein